MLLSANISVAARDSELSRVQVQEVLAEVQAFYPDIRFNLHYLKTQGDLDLKTPLSSMGKTDFFTREIDEMQEKKLCRLGIHSAKDLPEELRESLTIAALTQGKDPSDSLVLGKKPLNATSRIGVSSKRRIEVLQTFLGECIPIEVRGTIGQRLQLLEEGIVDGLIVAEAALIRLNLTHLPRLHLPGETAPYQGKLAVIALKEDEEMLKLFSCIDIRQLT